ncbi:hypothetical protein [Leptolyngbya sp. NIES-2104]|uniref:hypothetical protein n=1 Tax=Leptolyngbya sp. NIES-2104 TaxID=1552121 RepID=UPI0006EC6314|nr:hypothetical protein [Leptolyngbya sp. NIES-2104]GAP98158.1 hypothetical protein NIES2104_47110 [Leptolyngbya sp. NIES-2104]
MKYGLSWILVGVLGLTGCDGLPFGRSEPQQNRLPDRWQTYRNPRFGFEFLYPEGWVDSIPPENQDGIAFSDPRNNGFEIRSWAKLMRSTTPAKNSPAKPTPNFTTEQGIPGRLEVKVEKQTSTMMLTVYHKDVEYHWRGVAPSSQFGNFYRFFSFIASRYRVPE